MKQFVIKAYDSEGKLDKRMEVRPNGYNRNGIYGFHG